MCICFGTVARRARFGHRAQLDGTKGDVRTECAGNVNRTVIKYLQSPCFTAVAIAANNRFGPSPVAVVVEFCHKDIRGPERHQRGVTKGYVIVKFTNEIPVSSASTSYMCLAPKS